MSLVPAPIAVVPLLELQTADAPERPAYVPPGLDSHEVRALIADAYPGVEQAHQVHRVHSEIVHAYRRSCGEWVVVFDRGRRGRSSVKEAGGPLWDRIVSLVAMWEAVGRPADYRSMGG